MPGKTTIGWTDQTWNIAVVGCDRVSPGCDHCYAEALHTRFHTGYQAGRDPIQYAHPFSPPRRMRDVLGPVAYAKRLAWPLTQKRPARIFVNSMTDLLAHQATDEDIREVFAVMRQASWHQFQVLTKRSNRLARLGPTLDWPPNVWAGVSVESQLFLPRLDQLGRGARGARYRFVSIEPLLAPIGRNALAWALAENHIDWVIVGAESGRGARPMEDEWVCGIRDACVEARVALYFKQRADAQGHKQQHPLLDGVLWEQWPDTHDAPSDERPLVGGGTDEHGANTLWRDTPNATH